MIHIMSHRRKRCASQKSRTWQHRCARLLIAASVIALVVDTFLPPNCMARCTGLAYDRPALRGASASPMVRNYEISDKGISGLDLDLDLDLPLSTVEQNWNSLRCHICANKMLPKYSNKGTYFRCTNPNCNCTERSVKEYSQYNDPPLVLRDYQEQAAIAIDEALEAGEKKIACCLATGAGKTSVGNAAITRYLQNQSLNVMWIAPFGVLLEQADRNRQRIPGAVEGYRLNETSGRQKAQSKSGVIFYSSLQKLYRMINGSEKFDSLRPSVVVWDEYHWAETTIMGSTVRDWAKRENITLIGLSATPRCDTEFNIVYMCPMRVLAEEGYLAWPRIYSYGHDGEPLSIQHADKEAAMQFPRAQSAGPGDVVDHYIDGISTWGKTFFKVRTLQEIEHYTELLEEKKVKVLSIHYKQTMRERTEVLNVFEKCKGPCVLLSVNICAQGVDIPSLKSVFLTHRILGRHTYVQVIGRGARKVFGKSEYNIVEFDPALWKIRDALYLPLRRLHR